MHGDARCARHRVGEEQPGVGAIVRRHHAGGQLAAVWPGGVEGVAVERVDVDGAREHNQRPLRDTHVATAVGRGQRDQGEGRQRVHRERACQCRAVAGGVTGGHRQGVAAHAQAAEIKRGAEATTACIKTQASAAATIKAVDQLGDARAGAQRKATQPAGTRQRVAVGQCGDGEQRPHRVEQEAAGGGSADIARRVGGTDAVGVFKVGRAVHRQGCGEAEMPGGVQRQVACCTAVDANGRAGHTRQVVQHLAADGEVGIDGRRCGHDHDLGRLHVLRQRKLGQHGLRHMFTDRLAGQVVRHRMDAAVDTAQACLVSRLAEAGEVAHHVGQRGRGGGKRGVVAKGGNQDARRRGAEGGVARDITGVRRCDQQRGPVGVDRGGGIAVQVSALDGGDRAPHVVGVFGVPAGDGRIGQRHVKLRHQAGIGADRVALGCRHLRGDQVPVAGRGVAATAIGPEVRLLGLVCGAAAASGTAQAFNLVQLGGVLCRVQCRRCRGTELIARSQRKRGHLGPLHVLRHQVQRPGGAPLADGGAAAVRNKVEVTVGGADVDDGTRNAVAQRNAGSFGGAVGNGPQAGGQRSVKLGALRRKQRVQHAVGGLGRCGLGVHTARDRALHQEGRCALDGRKGVVHRNALHGQHAGGHGRVGHV